VIPVGSGSFGIGLISHVHGNPHSRQNPENRNNNKQFDQGKAARPHCDVRVIAGIWQLDIQGVYSFCRFSPT